MGIEYHRACEIDESLNDILDMARTNYNMTFPLYKMNERSKAFEHLIIGQNILIEFGENTGFTHPLLKVIEEITAFIKQEQSY